MHSHIVVNPFPTASSLNVSVVQIPIHGLLDSRKDPTSVLTLTDLSAERKSGLIPCSAVILPTLPVTGAQQPGEAK